MRAMVAVGFGVALLSGCGAVAPPSPNCALTESLKVSPPAGTANHASVSPGNQQKFTATLAPTAAAGCAVPAIVSIATPTWTNPDPLDVQISSSADATNGVAICKGKTSGAVDLTAVNGTGQFQQSVTVQLTCQ